jgi:DNA-binding LacI/PurR family transcriptional regulator
MSLEPNSGGPLYQQLRQELFARIRRGEFAAGDLLPSENQLCDEYGVSLTTARRALLELVKEGVVRRRAGVGTMVAPRVRAANLTLVSIHDLGDAWRRISSAMGELVAGIGELAWQRSSSFSMSGFDEEGAEEHLRALVEARTTDGVLLRVSNDIREEYLDILENAGMPYVVIKRQFPRRALNCVISNDVLGARLATEHLLEQGHKRIGFVCAKASLSLTQERLIGYRDALKAAGLDFDESLVRLEPSFHNEMGYRAARALLQLPDRPTALFVASDTMVIGGYQAARDLGLNIPADVAFLGYDDISPVALLQPPLTTIRTAYYDFGRLAAELLLDLIDGQKATPQRVIIQPALIVRESTSTPPATPQAVKRPRGGSLAGNNQSVSRSIAVIGRQRTLTETIASRLTKERVAVAIPNWQLMDVNEADACVCICDLRRDLEESLEAAHADGEAAARSMSRRHTGVLVLVALVPHTRPSSGIAAAAQAGLHHLTMALAARWASHGIRVNAVLVTHPERAGIDDLCHFFLAHAPAALTGQVLSLEEPISPAQFT